MMRVGVKTEAVWLAKDMRGGSNRDWQRCQMAPQRCGEFRVRCCDGVLHSSKEGIVHRIRSRTTGLTAEGTSMGMWGDGPFESDGGLDEVFALINHLTSKIE